MNTNRNEGPISYKNKKFSIYSLEEIEKLLEHFLSSKNYR